MKETLLSDMHGRREWAVVLDPGDDAMVSLQQFSQRQHLTAAHFTAIGAFSSITVAWFDLEAQKYRPIEIAEQVEVLNLTGDVAEAEGKPVVHAHVCVAKRDGTAHGGHLQKGIVCPTLEIILTESPAHLHRTFRAEFGIPLIDLSHGNAGRRPVRAASPGKE